MKLIFRTNGIYIGFIKNNYIFSRDGEYLGWVEENNFCWDLKGRFKGQIYMDKYIILNQFTVIPLPRMPKMPPITPALPNPPANIVPISLPVGFVDSF